MISMTFGTMPTREQFSKAWDAEMAPGWPGPGSAPFHFGNDPRVGNAEMSEDELWAELQKAFAEYQAVDGSSDDGGDPEKAGDWCSSVLGCLGIEWV